MTDRNDDYRPGQPASNPQGRGVRHPGQSAQSSHVAEEWAGRDYARGQLHGRQGLEREYGTRYDRDYGETRPQAAPRGHAQGWEQGERAGARGRPDASGYRGPEAAGRPWQGAHEYEGYDDRQAGEGYGRSSGYGNPEQDRYAGGGYRGGPAFVSPGDTQQVHSGQGRRDYSGMGPKNYRRSDARITEDLCERLTHDRDIDASDVEVRVADGTATLEGTVPQRWMKHRAEDLADGCAGVRTVENRIKVQSAASYSGPSTQHDISGGADTLGGQAPRPGGTAH